VKLQRRAGRQVGGGTKQRGSFDRKEHPLVLLGGRAPIVVPDELAAELVEPAVGSGVGSTQGVWGGEGNLGQLSPVVHVPDVWHKCHLRMGLGH
jgi:hypothetical protein